LRNRDAGERHENCNCLYRLHSPRAASFQAYALQSMSTGPEPMAGRTLSAETVG
jgi:hypothetical protein